MFFLALTIQAKETMSPTKYGMHHLRIESVNFIFVFRKHQHSSCQFLEMIFQFIA